MATRTDSWVLEHSSGHAVNDLINHLGRVSGALDDEVSEVAFDTGCTERDDVIANYDARQKMVREMVVLAHKLNSILPDNLSDVCTSQPTNYT